MTRKVYIVWTSQGVEMSLEITGTESDPVVVAEAWARRFTRMYGIEHSVKVEEY